MASSAPDHLRTPGLISNRPCYEGIKIRSNILTEGSITELVKAVDEEMDGIASEQRKRLETIDTELEEVKRRAGPHLERHIATSDIDIADASDRIKGAPGEEGAP